MVRNGTVIYVKEDLMNSTIISCEGLNAVIKYNGSKSNEIYIDISDPLAFNLSPVDNSCYLDFSNDVSLSPEGKQYLQSKVDFIRNTSDEDFHLSSISL